MNMIHAYEGWGKATHGIIHLDAKVCEHQYQFWFMQFQISKSLKFSFERDSKSLIRELNWYNLTYESYKIEKFILREKWKS